jgi:sugar-phosphatase
VELKPGITLPATALLFDMDGTLVDSTAIVEKIWRRFAQRHQLDAAYLLANSHGCRTEETVARFAPAGVQVAAEAARITAEEIADTDGVIEIPGAARLLAALAPQRWAVVTSASRALAITRLTAAGLPIPAVLISAEDVARGKPHPEGFLAAAKALGVDPADCIAFEDAPAGMAAVHAAGIRLLALATTLTPEQLPNEMWIRDFTQLAVEQCGDQSMRISRW